MAKRVIQESREAWAKQLEKGSSDSPWTFADFTRARAAAAEHPQGDPGLLALGLLDGRDSASTVSVQIALALGMQDVAGELLQQHLVQRLANMEGDWKQASSLGLLQSDEVWKLLNDGWLRREIGMTQEQVKAHTDNVVFLASKRLDEGRCRPYKDLTIEELAHLYNNHCLIANRLLPGWLPQVP